MDRIDLDERVRKATKARLVCRTRSNSERASAERTTCSARRSLSGRCASRSNSSLSQGI